MLLAHTVNIRGRQSVSTVSPGSRLVERWGFPGHSNYTRVVLAILAMNENNAMRIWAASWW